MLEKKWWQKEVIYQIYPKSFKDTNNDGIGDIPGIIEKLDYLKELGVTCLWICPFYKSPMIDNGYDISDYKNINEDFGTLKDVEELIAKAKKMDIKIILDLVINHSSDQHKWFQEALKNPKSKYRNYYIFKDAVNGQPPNNWRSLFGDSVWEKVPGEDTYYFHVFNKGQPDLNWENPELKAEIYEMINWWLKKGISGFRVDAITFIKKSTDWSSMPVDGADGLASCKPRTLNQPGIGELLTDLRKNTFDKMNAFTVGEAPGVSYDQFKDFIGKDGYFSMIFDFKYADLDVKSGTDWFLVNDWDLLELKKRIINSQNALNKSGWGANFIENHDQPRSLSKYIKEPELRNLKTAKGLALMYFYLRGTPFIYQAQELGMQNFERIDIKQFNDLSSIDNYYRAIQNGVDPKKSMERLNSRSRDNSRTPFPWDSTKYGGFSETKPWIEMTQENPKNNTHNNELLDFYKTMIKLRQDSIYSEVLTFGEIEFEKIEDKNFFVYNRFLNNKKIKVVVNFSKNSNTFEYDKSVWKPILDTHNLKEVFIEKGAKLQPYQGLVLESYESK